ncbi:MAG: PKD domain-containing protein [candidate division WOR-3 bacterium]
MRCVTVAALCLLIAGCQRNRPPSVPELNGPTAGRPGERLVFTVAATDPEGDEVAYKINWGDTSVIEWSGSYASGQPVRREHVYADSGTYTIRVMARDSRLAESGWSSDFAVVVRLLPPNLPEKPQGPTFCTTGVNYEYRFRASHPQNDSLWYQIDWGGTVSDWHGPVPADSWYRQSHSFDSIGLYALAVRARDSRGQLTGWSDTLLVTVVSVPGGPPTGFGIEAASDTTVRLFWSPPLEGEPNRYRLSFKAVDAQGFTVVAETLALSVEHNPNGWTGTYKIAAIFGATVYEDTLTASTVPIRTGAVTIGELSGSGRSGCGWNRALGNASSFPMTDTLYCDSVDCYCTDFKPGSAGPVYSLASPDTAVFDSGRSVPQGRWRHSRLAILTTEQGPLPPAGDTSYHRAVALTAVPASVGVLTADGYCCLVKVTQIRLAQQDIRAQAWFQPVRGLRLIRH